MLFTRQPNETKLDRAHRRVWAAVVVQAIKDYRNPSAYFDGCSIERRNAGNEALQGSVGHFLFDDDETFFRICRLAGLDGKRMRVNLLAAREAWDAESAAIVGEVA